MKAGGKRQRQPRQRQLRKRETSTIVGVFSPLALFLLQINDLPHTVAHVRPELPVRVHSVELVVPLLEEPELGLPLPHVQELVKAAFLLGRWHPFARQVEAFLHHESEF